MMHPGTAYPRATNPYPWVRSLPFNPDSPFSSGGLGVLMNTGATADPDASTQRYLVSSGTYQPNASASAGAIAPIANPSNLITSAYWYEELEKADCILIRPYMVLYDAAVPTALASAASAAGIAGTLSFYLIKRCAHPLIQNRPVEYTAEWKGSVDLTNAATRIASTTKQLPTGAQWCDVGTAANDAAIDPGIVIEGDIAGGALRIRFDQEGAVGLLTYATGQTTNSGLGWLRSHL